MERIVVLVLGVVAWAGVAGVAFLSVNAWADDDQALAFLPIAVAVFVAWLIGDWVTQRVFLADEEEAPHGNP